MPLCMVLMRITGKLGHVCWSAPVMLGTYRSLVLSHVGSQRWQAVICLWSWGSASKFLVFRSIGNAAVKV